MKILIVSNMYPSEQKPYAGIFVKNQYEYFRDMLNEDIEIFYMERAFTNALGSIAKYLKAFVRFLPFYGKEYDIVHVHFFYPLYLLAYLYKLSHPRAMILVTFHGNDITGHINGGLKQSLFSFLARKCDCVISVGKDLAAEIEQKLSIKVNKILSAGVSRQTFFRMPTVMKEYDIIFVGSFIERKGIDLLLDAIALLDREDVTFCFVGSGPYSTRIKELSSRYKITLKENQTQEQLRRLYNASRFFVFPSRDEPFGLVATESLYCGTPAVVSANGGLKEQVVDGENGFLLREITPEKIRDTLESLLLMHAGEYDRMSAAAEQSNSEFSLEAVCKTLLDIYTCLVSKKKCSDT